MKDINLLPWRAYLRERKQKRIKLLFCATIALFFVLILLKNWHFHTSIKRLDPPLLEIPFQLAGYLREDNQSWALILFPHGELKAIQAIKINEHSVTVEFNHKKITLNN